MEEVAHDVARALGLLLDQIELLTHRLAGLDPLLQKGGEPEHARQRVVDLVGDVRRQLTDRGELGGLDQLGLRLLELRHLLLDALVEARVLRGDRRLERDALRQLELVGREAVRIPEPGDGEAADGLALPAHRLHEQRLVGQDPGDRMGEAWVALAVVRVDRVLEPPPFLDHWIGPRDLRPREDLQHALGHAIAHDR